MVRPRGGRSCNVVSDDETLRIEIDQETRDVLAKLPPERASILLSRAVDAAGADPCKVTAADLRRIAVEDAATMAEALPRDDAEYSQYAVGPGAAAREVAPTSGERPSGARMLLILGTSALVGSGVALGALLIPSVVHANASRILIVVAMLGTAAATIGAIGPIIARLTAAGAPRRTRLERVSVLGARTYSPRPAIPHHATMSGLTHDGTELRQSLAPGQTNLGPARAFQITPAQAMLMPDDRLEILRALRFGWYVAEFRGRNWPGGPQPAGVELPDRPNNALPMRIERTRAEVRFETQVVLERLAADLGLDTIVVNGQQQSLTAAIDQQARALASEVPGSVGAAQSWGDLAATIYRLDAHTQDSLTARSELQSAAYQLGRGLAEVYWALDPSAVCKALSPDCWTFLLGDRRCQELGRLVGRLSAYFSPFCAPAVAGTIRLWQSVANDVRWRDGAQDDLYQQLRRWYELLVLGQDPSTLIKPYALLRNWHASLRALQALWIPLVTAAGSLGLVVALVPLIASGSSMILQALFGVLGAAGLSAAAVQARLKTAAQGLVTRMRQDAYTDLVAVAIAEAPRKPGVRRPDKLIAQEIRKRTLTTMADAAVP
jgi:hypothetical protein